MNNVRLDQCKSGDYIRWWEKGKKFSEAGKITGFAYTTGMVMIGCTVYTNCGQNRYLVIENIETIHNYGQPLRDC